MERNELEELLDEFRDANSDRKLLEFLKEQLILELENYPSEKDSQKHNLNMVIREIEEELDWIENDKLAEFDPEKQ